jgi:hypothetical protein
MERPVARLPTWQSSNVLVDAARVTGQNVTAGRVPLTVSSAGNRKLWSTTPMGAARVAVATPCGK